MNSTVFTGTPGVNDLSVEPQFVDRDRCLTDWDDNNGGAGTVSNAYQEISDWILGTGDQDYCIDSLLAYVREGFRPQNMALHNAGDPSDGSPDIGAIALTTGGNSLPSVTITSPANNATFTEPANVTITANASDSDGSVIVVDFYQGTTKLGADSTSPYSYAWTNVSAGSYALTAVAKDDQGDSTISSSAVNITVNSSGQPTGNLAKDQPAYDSSHEMASRSASAAVDSNMSTRWSSNYSDPQWMYVDLGASYSINRVILRWESAYATAYQIQVSNNASTWTDVYSTTSADGGTDDITFSSTSARYVRMYGTSRATSYGYSIWEFEVYGSGIAKTNIDKNVIPEQFSLLQNYPNPFNPETQISYHIASSAKVKLTIFNAKGQVVKNLADGMQSAGFYHVIWNGRNHSGIQESSGIYFYRLDVNHDKGHFTDIKKMLLIK